MNTPIRRRSLTFERILDAVADKVLSYKVPARTPKAKKRQRKRRKVQRELCI